MTFYLRQSTASQEILLGTFLDDDDGITPQTALSIANTDIKLFKNGGTTFTNKNSGGATHIATGNYYAVLDATDTNTLGSMEIIVQMADCLPIRREYTVLPAQVYDSLILGTDLLQVDMTQIVGAAVSTSAAQLGVNIVNAGGVSWASGPIGAAQIATDAFDADAFAASAITEITNALLQPIRSGTAQAGGAGTITLDSGASAVNDFYNGNYVYISAGTGAGQMRLINDYVGSTKVASVRAWKTNPDNTSVFNIYPGSDVNVGQVNSIPVQGAGTTGDPWRP
jgi:hypothetical protein